MGHSASSSKSGRSSMPDDFPSYLETSEAVPTQSVTALVLGCGDSGKTTLATNWKLIGEKRGWRAEDLYTKKRAISTSLKTIVELIKECILPKIDSLEDKVLEKMIKEKLDPELSRLECLPISKSLLGILEKLTQDAQVKAQCVEHFKGTQEAKVFEHYSSILPKLADPKYSPRSLDYLLTYSRTTGVVKDETNALGVQFNSVDVGGQKCERRKWPFFYKDADAVVFTVSAIEFDQNLFEDPHRNRLEESLTVFEDVAGHLDLVDAGFILVFTKIDILESKIKAFRDAGVDARTKFSPQFDMESAASDEPEAILEQLRKVFESKACGQKVSTFFVNLLDPKQVLRVDQELMSIYGLTEHFAKVM